MSKTGSYGVSQKPKSDTSFKSFIITLSIFLVCLLIIFVLLFLLVNKPNKDDTGNENTEVFSPINDPSKSGKLYVVTVTQTEKSATTKDEYFDQETDLSRESTESNESNEQITTHSSYDRIIDGDRQDDKETSISTFVTATNVIVDTSKFAGIIINTEFPKTSTSDPKNVFETESTISIHKSTSEEIPVEDSRTLSTSMTEIAFQNQTDLKLIDILRVTPYTKFTNSESTTTEENLISPSSRTDVDDKRPHIKTLTTGSSTQYQKYFSTTIISKILSTDDSVLTTTNTSNEPLKESNGTYSTPKYAATTSIYTQPTSQRTKNSTFYQTLIKNSGLTKQPVKNRVCQKNICKSYASNMLNSINFFGDPCDDFYDYACGGSASAEKIQDDQHLETMTSFMNSINDASQPFLQIFKMFFQNCLDYGKEFSYSTRVRLVETFQDLLTRTKEDLYANLILTQSMPFFDIGIDLNHDKNGSTYILQLTLPGMSTLKNGWERWPLINQIKEKCWRDISIVDKKGFIKLEEIYNMYKICQKTRFIKLVENYVTDINSVFNNPYPENITRDILKMMEEVQNILPVEYNIRQAYIKREYKLRTVNQLNERYPLVDWKMLFSSISDKTFNGDEIIQVYFVDYMDKMFEILNSYKNLKEVLNLYSILQLYENTVVPKSTENRQEYCLDMTESIFPDIVTNIYKISSDANLDKKNIKIRSLFDGIKNGLRDIFSSSELDQQTVTVFQKKISMLKLALVSRADTNQFQNISMKYYSSIDALDKSNIFINNAVFFLRTHRWKLYSLIGQHELPTTTTLLSYFVNPYKDLAKSFYPSEYIVVSAEIFPTALNDLPEYMKLAKVGMRLARELFKHFDPVGKNYFLNDSISSSDSYYSALVAATTIFMNGDFERTLNGKHIKFQFKGSLSTNERIVDNAALKSIYDYYLKIQHSDPQLPLISEQLSKEKIFFIAVAQEYCKRTSVSEYTRSVFEHELLPAPLRIENIMSNSVEFSEVFQCLQGTGMNPANDKVQFPFYQFSDEDNYYNSISS